MKPRIEMHNLDGSGNRRTQVYYMPVIRQHDYWANVTDVPCPTDQCPGTIRWYEAGYVPGYRICDCCQRHFLARGSADRPTLLRVGARRGCLSEHRAAFRQQRKIARVK